MTENNLQENVHEAAKVEQIPAPAPDDQKKDTVWEAPFELHVTLEAFEANVTVGDYMDAQKGDVEAQVKMMRNFIAIDGKLLSPAEGEQQLRNVKFVYLGILGSKFMEAAKVLTATDPLSGKESTSGQGKESAA